MNIRENEAISLFPLSLIFALFPLLICVSCKTTQPVYNYQATQSTVDSPVVNLPKLNVGDMWKHEGWSEKFPEGEPEEYQDHQKVFRRQGTSGGG